MRNVIVTGGTRGLGLVTASTLAAAGYRCIAVARKPSEALSEAAEAAARLGGGIEFRAGDLSELAQIGPLVRALRTEFGPIYGLVNNAGIGTSSMLGNMLDTDIQRLVQLNTVSPILLSKYVLRGMMLEKQGRIVNIASIIASTGYSGLSVYAATKASLVGFTRSLAREVGQLGITVNALAPGFIATDMTESMDESQRQTISRRSALRRLADPIDVARSVEFLLSEAGRNITGTTITVDAGNTA